MKRESLPITIIMRLCECEYEWVASIKRSRSEIKEARMESGEKKIHGHTMHSAHNRA